MNILVDQLAGEENTNTAQTPATLHIPSEEVSISVNHTKYHHFPVQVIRELYHAEALKTYILTKTQWTERQFQSIEWAAYEKVWKTLSIPQQVNWVKLSFEWQHTGEQKDRFTATANRGMCPLACDQADGAMHYCRCADDFAVSQKSHHLAILRDNLITARTSPSLHHALVDSIARYCHVSSLDPFVPAPLDPTDQQICSAIQYQ